MLIDRVKFHEGFRSVPYKCSQGKWTIGYGHRIKPMTMMKAHDQLWYDLDDSRRGAIDCISWNLYVRLNRERRDVLIEMCFQMGINGLKSFKKMKTCLRKLDFEGAANEMLDSRWHDQTPKRCETLALIMKNGTCGNT